MRFNHMFDIAFTVECETESPFAVSDGDLLAALERRVAFLKANPMELADAFVYCDSYETDSPEGEGRIKDEQVSS